MGAPTPQQFRSTPPTRPAFLITSPAEVPLYCPGVETTGTGGLPRKSAATVNITGMVCVLSMSPRSPGEWAGVHVCEQ